MVSFTKATLALVALLPLTLASPSDRGLVAVRNEEAVTKGLAYRDAMARRDTPVHCVDDDVNGPQTTGNLLCLDLGSIPPGKRDLAKQGKVVGKRQTQNTYTCDECLGLNGNTAVTSDPDVSICYITIGDDSTYGNVTSCPGDPSPTTNPDGSAGSSIYEGIMDTYCAVAGTDGLFGWTTFAVCYAYTFSQNGGDAVADNTAGAILLCDTFFSGLCTFLTETT